MTSETQQKEEEIKRQRSAFTVSVPSRFFPLTLLISFVMSFSLGRVSRSYAVVDSASGASSPAFTGTILSFNGNLPIPSLTEGAKVSKSRVYGSPSSHWIHAREIVANSKEDSSIDEEEDDEDISLGQQLMLDFEHVDSQFLASAERLSNAIITALEKASLDPVAYHCYRPESAGSISCQWALSNGRVSFTSWPESSVLALDLFLVSEGDEDELLSTTVMPIFEEAFSVASANLEKGPKMHWLLKTRGFEAGEASEGDILASSDMDAYPLAAAATYKKHVASVQSAFQTINVFDVLMDDRPLDDYEKSLAGDDSYQSQHPELFEPDRIVFMGGLLQSRRLGDAAYHEALVHPSLFAHPNPRRVAIIGGGEGATLREILKHNTIDSVVMIDIDKMIVEISKEFLPGWNNCTNLVGRANSCFEDEKARVYLEDAFKWFKDRFLEGGELEGTEDPFDVIIMDALDPQGLTEFVANLYTDKYFYESLYRGLTDDGILVAQLGSARAINDPPEDNSVDRFRLKYIEGLAQAGFKATREYAEGGCGFGLPWLFAISFKEREDEFSWFASDAEVDWKIRTRAVPTIEGKSPFHYFDSASMRKYKYPPKTSALVHCRREPIPEGCKPQEGSKASNKVKILPSYHATLEEFENKSPYGQWYKDVFEPYGDDHLRSVGDEFTYNPDGDRRVIFD